MWEAVERAAGPREGAGHRCAPDATAQDLRVLWGGAARMLAADEVDDPAEWRRYAALVLDALRA